MKTKLILKIFYHSVLFGLCFTQCSTNKHLNTNQYLLSKTKISKNGKKIHSKDLKPILKQIPNKKIAGIIPLYLGIYNLSRDLEGENYFKKIGEPPVILNYRLARKSSSQLELHYKNLGYLDAIVNYNVITKKHKAELNFNVITGSRYTINKVNFEVDSTNIIHKHITSLLEKSKIKTAKKYNFNALEVERTKMAKSLQNLGYHRFNKEYIHFLADTNATTKKVDLKLIVKPIETITNNTIIQEKHRLGIVQEINVRIGNENEVDIVDTLRIENINFIFTTKHASLNFNRIAEKILFLENNKYNKTLVDKSYRAIAELQIFKKITFDFDVKSTIVDVDYLVAEIQLIPGKKIAYALELEATSNPELNQGISGSASISNYNTFRGAEHLQLTYKGSNNFNNIKENGLKVSLAVPSLLSPFRSSLNKNSRTKTVFSTSVTEQQRPEFIRNSIRGSFHYEWNSTKNHVHKLTLFNLSYVNFQGDSADLSAISEYLIAKDYSNHLIPTSSYTLQINNGNSKSMNNGYFLKIHLESSGSILHSVSRLFEFNQLKDEDGIPIIQENGNPSYTLNLWNQENIFTQYIKSSIDYRHYWKIDRKNSIALRSFAGIIYAYGNMQQAPFHKKFIAGGANDLRGWQAFKRPTGMLSTTDTLYTGGVKLLSSLEYRFNVIKNLKGALFVDAGNIWEISKNNTRYEQANFHWNDFMNEIAIDVGFGLRYDFQYFIVRTDLGFPIREPNESLKLQWDKVNLRDSQLNIGLGYPF